MNETTIISVMRSDHAIDSISCVNQRALPHANFSSQCQILMLSTRDLFKCRCEAKPASSGTALGTPSHIYPRIDLTIDIPPAHQQPFVLLYILRPDKNRRHGFEANNCRFVHRIGAAGRGW
jgi:hypothetical protein